jgi:hypothetical protein
MRDHGEDNIGGGRGRDARGFVLRRRQVNACPSPHVIAAERGYVLRRVAYVGLTTFACITVPSVLTFRGYSGPMAETLTKGLLDLAQVLAWLYLGAGVLDRSGVLAKIGEGFQSRRGPPSGG